MRPPRKRTREANQRGVERAFELASELGIDCELRRKPNVTYAESADDRGQIEAEVGGGGPRGLPAQLVEELDLPFPVAAAVSVANQAEFHPMRYLEGDRRRARAPGRARARGHDGGVGRRRLALPGAHGGRAHGHRRERRGGHAPAVPRSRPVLRALSPGALVRGGGALRGRRRGGGDVPEHGVAGAFDSHAPARREELAARRRREPQDRPGQRRRSATSGWNAGCSSASAFSR